MRNVPFTETIAERELVLRRADGSSVETMLQIGKPVWLPGEEGGHGLFASPFRIVGLDREEKQCGFGVDSAQALVSTLSILPAWLSITAKIYGGVFEAHGGPDHGFPDWLREQSTEKKE